MTTEIPLKECSAYGQIDQGGDEREEPHIYERPQWLHIPNLAKHMHFWFYSTHSSFNAFADKWDLSLEDYM